MKPYFIYKGEKSHVSHRQEKTCGVKLIRTTNPQLVAHMQYKFWNEVVQWGNFLNFLNICHYGSIYKWWQQVRTKFDKSERKFTDGPVNYFWCNLQNDINRTFQNLAKQAEEVAFVTLLSSEYASWGGGVSIVVWDVFG